MLKYFNQIKVLLWWIRLICVLSFQRWYVHLWLWQRERNFFLWIITLNLFFVIYLLGETSSGKSTVINLLIGEHQVLPTKITPSTTKICRIRRNENYSIIAYGGNENYLQTWKVNDLNDMADKLESLACEEDTQTTFLDILMPVQMIQVCTSFHLSLYWPDFVSKLTFLFSQNLLSALIFLIFHQLCLIQLNIPLNDFRQKETVLVIWNTYELFS